MKTFKIILEMQYPDDFSINDVKEAFGFDVYRCKWRIKRKKVELII